MNEGIVWGQTVKDRVKEMKVSMGGKEKWKYLRRVEKVVDRLGIQDQKMTDYQLYEEFHRRELERVWKEIHKYYKNKKWIEFDKAQEEVDVLLDKINELKDT